MSVSSWRLPLLPLLACLPLLGGCEVPAPSAYWSGPATTDQADGLAKQYETLMAQGTRANLAGRSTEAKARFREALELQRKRFGANRPQLAQATMSLALQLSIEGQYPEADSRFAEAGGLVAASRDPSLNARLLHYRGMHLLNQNKPAEGDVMLGQAQKAWLAIIPPDALTREPVTRTPRNRFDVNIGGRIGSVSGILAPNADPAFQPALLGLIEVLRNRAIALRELNRPDEAETLTQSAARIAASNDLGRASVYARLFRTAGVTSSARSLPARAMEDLGRSDDAFSQALPGTKPAAEAALIRAGELIRSGRTSDALSVCRRAVATFVAISEGTSPDLMAPCLEAYAASGTFSGTFSQRDIGFGPDARASMFLAAQLAQGTITSHQIAQASAALAENARDPRVGDALRRRGAWQRELDKLYRAIDTIGPAADLSERAADESAALRTRAEQAQDALAKTDAEVRTLSPNYGQLVQDVVPASTIFATLRPDEAFVAMFLSKNTGWTFVLRNREIGVFRIEGGAAAINPLVRAVRAGIEQVTAGGPPPFDIDATRRLYDLTLGPAAGAIAGARSLVIAPTGSLLSVPFELLLTGPADPGKLAAAPFLVKQATITHVPAATNFVSLRRVAGTSAATKQWFGFGDFRKATPQQVLSSFPASQCGRDRDGLARLPLLPGATAELRGAAAILGAAPNDALLGDAFTADQVMKLKLNDYQILHFAAHAILPAELRCQTEAAIITSPPPGAVPASSWLLTASRLLDLDLDANLVILSACNSGGGDGQKGESLSGLARSFFFAKARSLMVTHWEVNDAFASVLVQLTVKTMKEKPGLGVTGALRDAQMTLLDKAAAGTLPGAYGHPFFWAPFAVIGEGGQGGGRTSVSSLLQTGL